MSATTQISVTNIAFTAVTAVSYCHSLRITENRGVAGWPTSDFLLAKPSALATPVRVQAGAQYTFTCPTGFFCPGGVVGFVKMVAGSTTFDQDEDLP